MIKLYDSLVELYMIYADSVLLNGNIITMDVNNSIVNSISIKDSSILSLGTVDEITKQINDTTQVFDLNGKYVTPGLIDSHSHLASTGIELLYVIDLSNDSIKSIKDVLDVIKSQSSKIKKGEWILGSRLNESSLDENRLPNRFDLDLVSPHSPVYITHSVGHFGVVNTFALNLAGITKDTPQPMGGTIDKDPKTGEPTGILREPSAMNLVRDFIPSWSSDHYREGIKKAIDEYLKEGITANKDPGPFTTSGNSFEAYKSLHESGELKMRIYLLLPIDSKKSYYESAKIIENYPSDDILKLGGVKIFLDGSIVARTAWSKENWYANGKIDPDNNGYPVIDLDLLHDLIKLSHENGFQVNVHSIGDKSTDFLVKAYLDVLSDYPKDNHRHSIIHGMLIDSELSNLIKKADLIIETQPNFLYFFGANYVDACGPERTKLLMPLKSLLNNGIIVSAGSDSFICPHSPKYGLIGATTRYSLNNMNGDYPTGTEEKISIMESLKMYTYNSAYCLFWDDKIGSLESGKKADLVIWSGDLLNDNVDSLLGLKAETTFIDGKVVYSSK